MLIINSGTFLVIWWLRLHVLMHRGYRFDPWVGELRSHMPRCQKKTKHKTEVIL